jgi:uncharacterized protein (TIGR03663 family)
MMNNLSIAELYAAPDERTRNALTLEVVAWIAVALLAAALRLGGLGLRPLSDGEASQALAAVRFTSGTHGWEGAPAGTVPALFTGNVLSFTLFGAGDAVARLLPVWAGLLLVLLPYGLRHRLGRGGALAAALLLAISPTATYFSRTLDSPIVAALCGLTLAVGLIRYVDTRQPVDLYLAAAALGLGLAGSPGIYALVLILGLFVLGLYLVDKLLNRESGWSSLLVAWWAAHREPGLLARAGVTLAAVFLLVATAFTLHPPGLGHAADLIVAWAKGFLPGPDRQPPIYPLLLLLRYELLILFLGLVGLVGAFRDGRGHGANGRAGSSFPSVAFLGFWSGMALLLTLPAGSRSAGNILPIVVPLALLAGLGAQRGWQWLEDAIRQEGASWHQVAWVVAISSALLVFIYLQLAMYSRAPADSVASLAGMSLKTTTSYLLLVGVAGLLLVGLGAAAWFSFGKQSVLGGAWLVTLLVLGMFTFKGVWGVNIANASDPRELMVMETTALDVRAFVEELKALSLAKAGDAYTLPVTVDRGTGPVIAWYLRDFSGLAVVAELSSPPATMAAVTLAVEDPPWGQTFRGRGFPLRTRWLPWGQRGQGLVRWLFYTEGPLPTVDQEVVLWVDDRR